MSMQVLGCLLKYTRSEMTYTTANLSHQGLLHLTLWLSTCEAQTYCQVPEASEAQ